VGNTVTLAFAGDSKSLEKTFDKVGAGAKDMAKDLDKSQADIKKFGGALDAAGGAADASESKFMGAADVLDGLGSAFGLPTDAATGMFRAFGDLSGGFATLQPLIGTVSTAFQTGLGSALTFIAAHPVILTVAALTAAFILLWKNSETFRDIVRGAFDKVGDAARAFLGFFEGLPGKLMGLAGTIKDALLWPYKTAFNEIAKIWNNTVGKLSFSIPSWVPGLGGKGFTMPNLPTFHMGGVVPGNPGQATPIMAMAGETVVPAGRAAGAGPIVVQLVVDGRMLAEAVTTNQRRNTGRGFTAA
jgi:hypothetical protein